MKTPIIYIPSYKRSKVITTHKLFENTTIEYYVVVNSAVDAVRYANRGISANHILVSNVKGITATREWIRKQTKMNDWFIMMDDIIKSIRRYDDKYYVREKINLKIVKKYNRDRLNGPLMKPIVGYDVLQVFQEIIRKAEENGAYLCGFAVMDNPMYRMKKWKSLGYISNVMVAVKRSDIEFDPALETMEECGFFAEHIARHGKVMINTFVWPQKKHYQPGGIGLYEDRLPRKYEECQYLVRKYPGLIGINTRRKLNPGSEIMILPRNTNGVRKWQESVNQRWEESKKILGEKLAKKAKKRVGVESAPWEEDNNKAAVEHQHNVAVVDSPKKKVRGSAPPSIEDVQQKFSSMVSFGKRTKEYVKEIRNHDLFMVAEIPDMHDQELDDGEKACWRNVGLGTAHKNSKNWAATFRLYNGLRFVNRPNLNVLELGCDEAFLRRMIHNGTYQTGTNYMGIDIKLKPMQQASDSMPKCNNPALFVVHDLYKGIPFIKSDSVDVLYCYETLEHLEEKYGIALLQEIKRVIKPDGIIILSIPNHDPSYWYVEKSHRHEGFPFHHREYTVAEFLEVAKNQGLKIVEVYGWLNDRKRIMAQMDPEVLDIFNRMCEIMGNQIPTQVFGQMYPEASGGVVYHMRK